MPEITGFKIPNHDEKYMYADASVRDMGYGAKLQVVNGSTDEEFLSNIKALCAEKINNSTFQALLYPAGAAFDGNSYVAQIWHNSDGSYIKIKAHGAVTTGEWHRVCYYNTWSDPEWDNPPMVFDVDYRTTQKWNGKSVYTKMVNCGYLSAVGSTKEYSHGASATNIINSTGTLSTGDALPYYNTKTEIELSCTPNNIKIRTIAWEYTTPAVTDISATVQIWYTKN